jgi:uncharacterized protein (TIGR03382 family)
MALSLASGLASAQSVAIDSTTRYQTIDGFGTCLSGTEAQQTWWQQLYFDDLQASMVRMDLTPAFTSTYSAESYCSPWFGQPAPLNLDTATSGDNGPDGTRTRRYTSAADYSNSFGGCSAPIAVMGPDIDTNVTLFDFTAQAVPGLVAQMGLANAPQLGGFKLYGSLWSPAPWVKMTSGNTITAEAWPGPTAVPWPFIWGGNFAGGILDVSGTALSQLNDGTADTSALTQFARGLAAFLRGFQNTYSVQFYAISIQNELDFEEFYDSAKYPLAAQYITALEAARTELDQYPDLANIKIIGPEDVIGDDAYALWQYGSGATENDKNLQFVQAVEADSTAKTALAGFAIHGYSSDGVASAGANPQGWDWWANGWTASPASGIPANVAGVSSFGLPSWMTETSGEDVEWLASSTGDGGFPDQGSFSIAIELYDALTTGQESAWLYWQLTDGDPANDSDVQNLTDATELANAPKYNAAKHYFRYIRPGAQRVEATVSGGGSVLASAFVLDSAQSLTVVLVNEASTAATVAVTLPATPAVTSFEAHTSSNGSYWQPSMVGVTGGVASVPVPGYGVVTLYGTAGGVSDGGVAPIDGGAIAVDGGAHSDAGSVAGDAGAVADAGAPTSFDAGSDSGTGTRDAGSASTAVGGCACGASGAGSAFPLGLLLAGWLARRRKAAR